MLLLYTYLCLLFLFLVSHNPHLINFITSVVVRTPFLRPTLAEVQRKYLAMMMALFPDSASTANAVEPEDSVAAALPPTWLTSLQRQSTQGFHPIDTKSLPTSSAVLPATLFSALTTPSPSRSAQFNIFSLELVEQQKLMQQKEAVAVATLTSSPVAVIARSTQSNLDTSQHSSSPAESEPVELCISHLLKNATTRAQHEVVAVLKLFNGSPFEAPANPGEESPHIHQLWMPHMQHTVLSVAPRLFTASVQALAGNDANCIDMTRLWRLNMTHVVDCGIPVSINNQLMAGIPVFSLALQLKAAVDAVLTKDHADDFPTMRQLLSPVIKYVLPSWTLSCRTFIVVVFLFLIISLWTGN
jgi:hypothetical protein